MMGLVVPWRRGWISILLLLVAAITSIADAQATTYYFSGAVQVSGSSSSGSSSPAVQAQCPADHPLSCSSIGASDWCCPSSNTCSWSNAQVVCCPSGQTCNGAAGGGGTYQTTTQYWQPTTTWAQPTTTVYAGGGGYASAGYTTPIYVTTTTQGYSGEYCSTLVEVGPNLPTTARGDCGTILIAEPGLAVREVMGLARLFGMVVGLQVVAALIFTWR